MLLSKEGIIQALSSQIVDHRFNGKLNIEEIIIDSRKAAKGAVFVAIKGENNDGNLFARNALENGCELAIVDDPKIFEQLNNAILVKNSFNALCEIAKYQREKTSAKIIALTGSVGKTSIKDMLRSAFEKIGRTNATSGNFNNHFGLPLTICNIKKDDEFVILEMGMNNPGEIEPLSRLARPDIAIISNIAAAHIGNFESEEAIALEKSAIFSGLDQNGIVILNQDDKYFDFLKNIAIKNNIQTENIISFGYGHKSKYKIAEINIKNQQLSEVVIKNPTKEMKYEIATSNKIIIFNSAIIAACLDTLTQNPDLGLESLASFKASSGRGNIIKLDKFTIIDDSYNANLTSSKAGVEYLSNLKAKTDSKRSVAILGDMLELGSYSDQHHQELINFCRTKNIDKIILIGSEMQKAVKNLCIDLKTYLNCKEMINEISNIIEPKDLILVKGSRGMKMEEIIENIKKL